MRPDRIVVGEVREAESLDLLIALNSGIPGMCTLHANSARDALTKLCTLPLLAGRNIDGAFVVPTVASSIDLVVHCQLTRDGRRRVSEILAPTGSVEGAPGAGGVIGGELACSPSATVGCGRPAATPHARRSSSPRGSIRMPCSARQRRERHRRTPPRRRACSSRSRRGSGRRRIRVQRPPSRAWPSSCGTDSCERDWAGFRCRPSSPSPALAGVAIVGDRPGADGHLDPRSIAGLVGLGLPLGPRRLAGGGRRQAQPSGLAGSRGPPRRIRPRRACASRRGRGAVHRRPDRAARPVRRLRARLPRDRQLLPIARRPQGGPRGSDGRPHYRDAADGTRGRRDRAHLGAARAVLEPAPGGRCPGGDRGAAVMGGERGAAGGRRAVAGPRPALHATGGGGRLRHAHRAHRAPGRGCDLRRGVPAHARHRHGCPRSGGGSADAAARPRRRARHAPSDSASGRWSASPRGSPGRGSPPRMAPYLADVSNEARILARRRTVEPLPVLGVLAAPAVESAVRAIASVFGGADRLALRLRQSGRASCWSATACISSAG